MKRIRHEEAIVSTAPSQSRLGIHVPALYWKTGTEATIFHIPIDIMRSIIKKSIRQYWIDEKGKIQPDGSTYFSYEAHRRPHKVYLLRCFEWTCLYFYDICQPLIISAMRKVIPNINHDINPVDIKILYTLYTYQKDHAGYDYSTKTAIKRNFGLTDKVIKDLNMGKNNFVHLKDLLVATINYHRTIENFTKRIKTLKQQKLTTDKKTKIRREIKKKELKDKGREIHLIAVERCNMMDKMLKRSGFLSWDETNKFFRNWWSWVVENLKPNFEQPTIVEMDTVNSWRSGILGDDNETIVMDILNDYISKLRRLFVLLADNKHWEHMGMIASIEGIYTHTLCY